jgi:hypothetical protein
MHPHSITRYALQYKLNNHNQDIGLCVRPTLIFFFRVLGGCPPRAFTWTTPLIMLDVSSLLFTVFVLLLLFPFYDWRCRGHPHLLCASGDYLKGPSDIVEQLDGVPLCNWPCWPLFIQQIKSACKRGGRGHGMSRVREGYKLILQQQTWGTGIENWTMVTSESRKRIWNFRWNLQFWI